MDEVQVSTRGLVGLLQDALLSTADPKEELPHLTAVLSSARGLWPTADWDGANGGEAGCEPADLLVATSTSVGMTAQCHTLCQGSLGGPLLVSAVDVGSVVTVFGALVKGASKTSAHQTVISVEGDRVSFREDPQLVPDGSVITVPTVDAEEFPRTIPEALEELDAGPAGMMSVDPAHLAVLAKVAKRRGMPVSWYARSGRVVVEVGAAYRAALIPLLIEGPGAEGTVVEVFDPGLAGRGERRLSVV